MFCGLDKLLIVIVRQGKVQIDLMQRRQIYGDGIINEVSQRVQLPFHQGRLRQWFQGRVDQLIRV